MSNGTFFQHHGSLGWEWSIEPWGFDGRSPTSTAGAQDKAKIEQLEAEAPHRATTKMRPGSGGFLQRFQASWYLNGCMVHKEVCLM